ncbi:hypothetical protein B0H17DRAFT_935289, partial [Mycena rosella]
GTPLLALTGMQCNRAAERAVPAEEGATMARQLGCAFFVETSARTEANVGQVFADVVTAVPGARGEDGGLREEGRRRKRRKCVVL